MLCEKSLIIYKKFRVSGPVYPHSQKMTGIDDFPGLFFVYVAQPSFVVGDRLLFQITRF